MNRCFITDRTRPENRSARCPFLALIAFYMLALPVLAQNQRSAWMWNAPSHPYGAVNVIGNPSRESELISYFGAWGFDRIYASAGTIPQNDPVSMARWNAALDDVDMDSQTLYGLMHFNPSQMANLVQDKLIDFNVSRADSRERFDAVHLDLEPHPSDPWKFGTPTEKRDLLYELRDTYAAIRSQLDNNGAPEVKVYADLPVWFDSTSSIGWTTAERNQWFQDIAVPLDGITLMAFERDTLSKITNGVWWEVANFNGEVRIGLNAKEVGPGNTFEDFDELIGMAEALESFYGTDITGIDFQPLDTYTDLEPVPVLNADFDEDGDVDGSDFLTWQRGFGIERDATLSQGDANGNGAVNASDRAVWEQQYGTSDLSGVAVVPEPDSVALAILALIIVVHSVVLVNNRQRGGVDFQIHIPNLPHKGPGR
jgi:hypothetical protein